MKKTENFLILCGMASRKVRLKKGEELWQELDELLPEAVAILYDDQPRVDIFCRMVKNKPGAYQKCLKEWLEDTVDSFWRRCDESVSFLQEKAERKQWQIYRHHLEALTAVK